MTASALPHAKPFKTGEGNQLQRDQNKQFAAGAFHRDLEHLRISKWRRAKRNKKSFSRQGNVFSKHPGARSLRALWTVRA